METDKTDTTLLKISFIGSIILCIILYVLEKFKSNLYIYRLTDNILSYLLLSIYVLLVGSFIGYLTDIFGESELFDKESEIFDNVDSTLAKKRLFYFIKLIIITFILAYFIEILQFHLLDGIEWFMLLAGIYYLFRLILSFINYIRISTKHI